MQLAFFGFATFAHEHFGGSAVLNEVGLSNPVSTTLTAMTGAEDSGIPPKFHWETFVKVCGSKEMRKSLLYHVMRPPDGATKPHT